MTKDRLFQLIRDEDVVLFVGAGFSLYAGYPSGKKLAGDIYNKLSESEKKEIDRNKVLPELCDDIYQLQGQNRNFLLRNVKEAFSIKPERRETHLQLSKIPLFKTIITTNYDTLIEDTHNDIEVLRSSKDLPLTDSKKRHLFKIHGDLTNLDEIILTQSDYDNYFTQNKGNNVYWNAVRSELARHHILFIGYSLDDINVKTIINKIYDELGDIKKQAYFVAPDLGKVKRSFLRGKNIEYIDSTGEEFIKELNQDLKENYIPYSQSNNVNIDTIAAFGESNGIKFELSKRRNKANIGGFTPIEPAQHLKQKIQFIIKPNVVEKFEKFKTSLDSELAFKQDDLNNFSFRINDIRINDLDSIKELSIKKLPRYEGQVVLVFEDGFETSEFNVLVRSGKTDDNEGVIQISLLGFEVKITSNLGDLKNLTSKLNLMQKRNLKNVNEGVYFYNILKRFLSSMKFKIYEGSEMIHSYSLENKFSHQAICTCDEPLDYFDGLKQIEKFYSIRFSNIDLEKISKRKLDRVLAFIQKRAIRIKTKKHSFKITDGETIKKDIKGETKSYALKISGSEINYINLHGHKLNIGFPMEFIKEGVFSNYKEVVEGVADEIEFTSKTGYSYLCFSENEDIELQNFVFPKLE